METNMPATSDVSTGVDVGIATSDPVGQMGFNRVVGISFGSQLRNMWGMSRSFEEGEEFADKEFLGAFVVRQRIFLT